MQIRKEQHRKSMRKEDKRVHSHVSRALSSLFERTLCLMATICSVFILNPTSNSVLGEHAPMQSRGRCRLPGTLMWGGHEHLGVRAQARAVHVRV